MKLLHASAALAGAALIASCSTATDPPQRTAREAAELKKALEGRTAGAPQRCIPNWRASNMQIVDDWTILYRDRGTIYVQKPRGGCHGLSNSMSLIRNQFVSTRLCRGDINRVVDLRTGFGTGACVFSEFIPYRRAS